MAGSSALIPEQRRLSILDALRRDAVLSYRQITDMLGVSQMTARRDVAALVEQGRAEAIQGGVTASGATRLLREPTRADKARQDVVAKRAIAEAAARLVTDSMTVYLDAGTTIQAIRPALEAVQELTVVSNDLGTIGSFLDHPSADLICVGGRIERDNQSMVGRLAALTLGELSLDLAFLSSSSWDLRHGVTTPVEAKIDPKRAAVASATKTVLLADSSKFGRFAKYRILRLDEVDAIITDSALPGSSIDEIRALGIDVTLADEGR